MWGQFTANPNGTTSVPFTIPGITLVAAWSAVVNGGDGDDESQDNWPTVVPSSITTTGFQVFSSSGSTIDCTYLAVGRIDI